ncbi:MAG: hypothetical protein K9G76_03980 [Bacteroidales bacterium]|nr:hypothetical protein [Bacteroidales bacterium]MCF8403581.1 hypothetical protein [Bacteroidales bacterium]
MEEPYCPNIRTCKLVNEEGFTGDEIQRKKYIEQYCFTENPKWFECKRYMTKSELNFCPDFVLPDTELSIDEIMDKFDNETFNLE